MTLKYVFYYRMINKQSFYTTIFFFKKRHAFTIECVTKLINIIVSTFFSFFEKKNRLCLVKKNGRKNMREKYKKNYELK